MPVCSCTRVGKRDEGRIGRADVEDEIGLERQHDFEIGGVAAPGDAADLRAARRCPAACTRTPPAGWRAASRAGDRAPACRAGSRPAALPGTRARPCRGSAPRGRRHRSRSPRARRRGAISVSREAGDQRAAVDQFMRLFTACGGGSMSSSVRRNSPPAISATPLRARATASSPPPRPPSRSHDSRGRAPRRIRSAPRRRPASRPACALTTA